MDRTQYYQEQQEAKRLHDRISSFMEDFKVGTLLGGSGIRKLRGAKPLALFTAILRCHSAESISFEASSTTVNRDSRRIPPTNS